MIASLLNIRGLLITSGVSIALGFASGWTVRDWRADSAELATRKKADEAMLKAVKQAYDAATETAALEQQLTTSSTEMQTRIREIYRETQVPSSCDVPDAGKRLLDEALATTGTSAAQLDNPLPSAP